MENKSINCVITSPPYYSLRRNNIEVDWPDGWHGELGQEPTPQQYIKHLELIFNEIYRVMADEANLFVVIADSSKNGNYQIPERFSLMMTDKLGFIRKNDIIWKKNNILPAGGAAARKVVPDYEHVYYFVKDTKKHYFKQLYEPLSEITLKEYQSHYDSPGNGKDYEGQGIQNPSKVKANIINRAKKKFAPIGGKKYVDNANVDNASIYTNNEYVPDVKGRLMRSVWVINHDNLPKDILHHSAFPRALVKRLLEMGCPKTITKCLNCGNILGYNININETNKMQTLSKRNDGDKLGKKEEVLQPQMQHEMGGNKSEEQSNIEFERLHTSMDQRKIRNGTQDNNGKISGKEVIINRSGSSHQRYNNRQPNRESYGNGEKETRSVKTSEQTYNNKLSLLSNDFGSKSGGSMQTCPKCKSNVTTQNGIVLDCFLGSGTLGVVANQMGIKWFGIEGNMEYLESINKRLQRGN